jgi:RNA polymerase sigma-70 factor (ECF subfamily)
LQTRRSPTDVTDAPPEETADLIRRLAGGDPSALEQAFAAYGPRCNAIAYRVLHDDDRARDAVQEAFLSLWRHRGGLIVRSSGLLPWLSVVTRNAALGILRAETARSRRESRVASAEIGGGDPSERVIRQGDAGLVRGALRELPREQRQVIELAYFRYLTLAQIAQQTATPLGTIKRRAQTAMRQLARRLSEGAT